MEVDPFVRRAEVLTMARDDERTNGFIDTLKAIERAELYLTWLYDDRKTPEHATAELGRRKLLREHGVSIAEREHDPA